MADQLDPRPTFASILAKPVCLIVSVPAGKTVGGRPLWWFQRACGRSLTDHSERGGCFDRDQVYKQGLTPSCRECAEIVQIERRRHTVH